MTEPSTEVVEQKTSFAAMTTDMVCTMDDVVSAFVATYEGNLFARKKDLSREIKAIEVSLRDLDKEVLAAVPGDEFDDVSIEPFGLESKLDGTSVLWRGHDDDDANLVKFTVVIRLADGQNCYSNKINTSRTKPIPPDFVGKHDSREDALVPLRAELAEVLDNIKGIARKERQVRGRIAIRKLEDSGYSNLMADPELKQLVQL